MTPKLSNSKFQRFISYPEKFERLMNPLTLLLVSMLFSILVKSLVIFLIGWYSFVFLTIKF